LWHDVWAALGLQDKSRAMYGLEKVFMTAMQRGGARHEFMAFVPLLFQTDAMLAGSGFVLGGGA